jgi:acyl-coenzyme A thioesterase PaaI-like protein
MKIRAWALKNVPLIHYTRPRVEVSNVDEVVITLPLRRRNKNHWGTMYFGALAVGADLAVGLLGMNGIEKSKKETGKGVSLVFSDFQAEFLRRPDGPVQFRCSAGQQIAATIQEAIASGERKLTPCLVEAFVGDELVARMTLGLSLKVRAQK